MHSTTVYFSLRLAVSETSLAHLKVNFDLFGALFDQRVGIKVHTERGFVFNTIPQSTELGTQIDRFVQGNLGFVITVLDVQVTGYFFSTDTICAAWGWNASGNARVPFFNDALRLSCTLPLLSMWPSLCKCSHNCFDASAPKYS